MKIRETKIQQYAIICTSVGKFRVGIHGTVEFDQEQPNGYYKFVFVHPDEISEFELTSDEYTHLQHTGIDEILLTLKSKNL
jgi:hypothetical protein